FGEPGQINALGMDMVVPPSQLDGTDDVILDQGERARIGSPRVSQSAVRSSAQGLRPTQADAHIVPPAQPWRQPQDLLFVPTVAMQKDQKRVRIIRLVSGGKKGPNRQSAGGLDL